jgi:hypothetical protein
VLAAAAGRVERITATAARPVGPCRRHDLITSASNSVKEKNGQAHAKPGVPCPFEARWFGPGPLSETATFRDDKPLGGTWRLASGHQRGMATDWA